MTPGASAGEPRRRSSRSGPSSGQVGGVQAERGAHVAALAALRDAGLVRYLGLSNVTVGQIDETLAIAPVAAARNRHSIDSRRPDADDVLRACAERGIAFVPFFAITWPPARCASRKGNWHSWAP